MTWESCNLQTFVFFSDVQTTERLKLLEDAPGLQGSALREDLGGCYVLPPTLPARPHWPHPELWGGEELHAHQQDLHTSSQERLLFFLLPAWQPAGTFLTTEENVNSWNLNLAVRMCGDACPLVSVYSSMLDWNTLFLVKVMILFAPPCILDSFSLQLISTFSTWLG